MQSMSLKTRCGVRHRTSHGVHLFGVICVLCCISGCSRHADRSSSSRAATAASLAGKTTGGIPRWVPGMRKTWSLDPMEQPGTVFHVEYSPDTSIVDLATVGRTLRGVSDDHRIFLFEDSPELRAKLIPGKFVLFQGLDLRKVDAYAVDPKTKNLIVGTETAPLRAALKNAQVQFKTPVNFTDAFNQLATQFPRSTVRPSQFASRNPLLQWWDSLHPDVYAASGPHDMEGEFEIADTDFATWKVHYHFYSPPDASDMHLDLQLAREANGLDAELGVKSQISNFIQQVRLEVAQTGVSLFKWSDMNLHGNGDFDWTIKSSENKTPMNEVRLKLPGKISIPLAEFELPMSVQISEALLFHPALTTKDEVAKGSFSVKYSGDQGFAFENSNMQNEGQSQGDAAIDQTFAFSPFASFGLVVAMAVPRIELRMGSEEIWEMAEAPLPHSLVESLSDLLLKTPIVGQWLNNKAGNPLAVEGAAYFQVVLSTTAAASGMQSLVPCQQFTMNMRGQVGVDAKWLGTTSDVPAKDVFSKDLIQRQPDTKVCGGG